MADITVILLVIATVSVAVHGNYVSAPTQTASDGIATIEFITLVRDGFVVIRAPADGEIGRVVAIPIPATIPCTPI